MSCFIAHNENDDPTPAPPSPWGEQKERVDNFTG